MGRAPRDPPRRCSQGGRRGPLRLATRCAHGILAAPLLLVGALACAHADCRLELELLAADLGKVKITQAQGQQLAPFVDAALRYCRTGHETLAVRSIDKAREIARAPKRDPLEPEDDASSAPHP